MDEDQRRRCRLLLLPARERGWTSLDELLHLSTHSPAQAAEVRTLAGEAGISLVDEVDEGWPEPEALAREGLRAFGPAAEAPAAAEELAPESPAELYLRDISQTPLLTAEEEVTLAQQWEAGREARQQLVQGTLEPATRARLEAALRTGEAARKRLIEANLRLVVAVARKYLGRGLPFLDLVQEGNIGLQRAVDKYDWRKGFRFSTYAYWWIRQATSRAVAEQGRTIRLPVHVIELLTRLYSTRHALHHELGREPTPAEIAARLGVATERVEEAFRVAKLPISLDTPLSEAEEATVADLIADSAGRLPAEEAAETVVAQTLDEALNAHLSPREAEVLRLRFGLVDDTPRTLNEAAVALGISRERVRQIEAEALQKLRDTAGFRQQFEAYVE
jgi:RNA polymerase primary sigma factor